MSVKGTVYLVGAGPGRTDLLTLRGADLLRKADVVVYDALVDADILRLAKDGAEVIYGGKRVRDHSIPQDELNRLLISKAREGKTVVRLKGGDPYVFGRGAEEGLELAEAGIPFEVVPGVSSFTAVPAYAGVPLTHRDMASRITLITGHADPETGATNIDWPHVAATPGTKVIMMGTERIGQIAATLVKHGMPPGTPIAVVRWGATARQQSVAGTLATIADVVAKERIGPPTVAVIGDVVRLREKLNWFEKGLLWQRRIVVTRATEQAGTLAQRFLDLGAEVLSVPTIKMEPPTDRQGLVDALLELNSYDWLVFTSPNGVNTFFGYFFKRFQDLRDLGGARIAAVGPGTAEALRALHLQVDVVPREALAASLPKALTSFESIENLKICLLRAEVANPELPRDLEKEGAIVDDIACYKTVAETQDVTGAAAALAESGADWVTFTSGSTVSHFHQRFDLPALAAKFPSMRLASIGPETTKAIRKLGLSPAIEAKEHTVDGLVRTLLDAETKSRPAPLR